MKGIPFFSPPFTAATGPGLEGVQSDNLVNWIAIAGPFAGVDGPVLVNDLGTLLDPEYYYRAVTEQPFPP